MSWQGAQIEAVVDKILAASRAGRRRLVALSGAPASGKSTLADSLAEQLNQNGCQAQVVQMDGFHLDNRILSERGILNRKGSPDSFDAAGLEHLCKRLATDDEVIFPVFDRARDISIAGAGIVAADCDTVIVEGNYLLFDTPKWRPLVQYWDVAISLEVPRQFLQLRLIDRWTQHGLSVKQAKARTNENDLKNADAIERHKLNLSGQITLRTSQNKDV